jgi:hypothetical protein
MSALVVQYEVAYVPVGGEVLQALQTVFWLPPHWTSAKVWASQRAQSLHTASVVALQVREAYCPAGQVRHVWKRASAVAVQLASMNCPTEL